MTTRRENRRTAKASIRYTGSAELPRLVTGPITGSNYVFSPGQLVVTVDSLDSFAMLRWSGDVTFERP